MQARIKQMLKLLFEEQYPEIHESIDDPAKTYVPCVPVVDFYPTASISHDWNHLTDQEKSKV